MSNILRALLITPEDARRFQDVEGIKYVVSREFKDLEAARYLKGFLMSLNYPMTEQQMAELGKIHEKYKNTWAEHIFSEDEALAISKDKLELNLNFAYISDEDELVQCVHSENNKTYQAIDSYNLPIGISVTVASILLDILCFYEYIVRMNIYEKEYFDNLVNDFVKTLRHPKYYVILNGAFCKEGIPYNFKIVDKTSFHVYYFDNFTTGDHGAFFAALAPILNIDTDRLKFQTNADLKFRQNPIDALPNLKVPIQTRLRGLIGLKPTEYMR